MAPFFVAPAAFDLRSRHGFEAMAEALEAEAPGGVGVAFRELDRVARSKRSTEEALAAWTLHAATEGTDATRRTTGVLGTSPKADREAIASMATGTDLAEKWRADPEFRGKLGEIAPVFASMATRRQDSQHHSFGLMEHVLRAVDAVDVTGLSERESRTLKAAALFHDCGKAEAAFYRVAKTYGRIVESFAGHAEISAAVAETVLRSAGFPEAETRDVAFLVRRHDSFMAFDGGPSGMESLEAAIRALADESGPERVALLARLMAADAAAQAETVHGRFGEIVATRGDKIAKAKAVERIALGF